MKRFLSLVAALCFAGAANAQITLSFTSNTMFTDPGVPVTFLGTISNASTTDTVFLNGISGSFDSANLDVDALSFLAFAPPSLAPGASYTGSLFDVLVNSGTTPGVYSGSVQLLGGTTDVAQNPLTIFQSLFVAVAVPEPGALALFALGGVGGLSLRRRPR